MQPTSAEIIDEEAWRWIRKAQVLREYPLRRNDLARFGICRFAQKVIDLALNMSYLLRAFQKTPDGKVEGPQGVQSVLGISKNAVYLQLRAAGLKAEDFRSPDVRLSQLMVKSTTLRPLLERLDQTILTLGLPS